MKLIHFGYIGLCLDFCSPVVSILSPFHGSKSSTSRLEGRQDSDSAYTYTFDQKIDHFPHKRRYAPHDKHTFKERYYVDSSYYKPGGPVFLLAGGEVAIEFWEPGGYLLNLIHEYDGLLIILEGRYYGSSSPYNTTTTDHLAYQTAEQTIADMNYFAKNVKIPGIPKINAPNQPWILYGGSLAGALVSFALKTYGNTFYAAIASSGVIVGSVGYPQWYNPIQKFASQDCVASINDIVDKIDMLVDAKLAPAIQQLKSIFGLEALTDMRDFARAIAFPLGGPATYPTNSYQEINWDPKFGSQDFFDFCRNVSNIKPPTNNTQSDWALANYTDNKPWANLGNYAAYIKRVVLPLCSSGDYNSFDCFGTQHPEIWADVTNNDLRSYLYTTCVEFGAYQVAQPRGQKSLVSRVLDEGYTQQWCNWAFAPGKHNTIPSAPNTDLWNYYGGINLTAPRLLSIDGGADVWRDLCYHSEFAPERQWGPGHEEYLINGAGHVWDYFYDSDVNSEPQFVKDAHLFETRTVGRWLKDFSKWKSRGHY